MSERAKLGNDVRPLSGCLTAVSTMENVFLNEREGSKEHRSEADHKVRLERQNPARNTSTERKQLLDLIDKTTTLESLSNEINEPVLDTEKLMLNAFLNEVRTVKPACLKNWSALQHYVYFIYRHVVSEKPSNNTEIFPNSINKKIRDLIESLLQEDIMQLFIRLVTLIREYALICRGFFDNVHNSKMATCLISLMSYYSAFCSAASKLAPLLPEFDFLIMERFNINWLCLNKSIFYHHVYLSSSVQERILPVLQKLKEENKLIHKNLLESYACFSEDMKLIASRWATLKIHISTLSHKRVLSDPTRHLLDDWKMFEEQKKILKSNYWITRSAQAIQVQEMGELDAHILSLVDDTTYIAEFLIDSQGQCMCEDCLAAEFRSNSTNVVIPLSFQNNSCTPYRLITCYICQDPIALDGLISHIATKHYDSHIQKTSSKLYVTSHPKRISKKTSKAADSSKFKEAFCFEGLLDRNLELKESIIKLVSGRDFRNNTTTEEKIDRIYVKDSKNDLLLMSKKTSNCSDSSLSATETEKLKGKPSNFPQAPEAPFIIKSPVSSVFQTSCETVQTKEPVFKIASEPPPVMQNEKEIIFKCAAKTNNIGETETSKTSINELFRRHETCNSSEIIKTAVTDMGKWKNANRIEKKSFKTLERNLEHCSNNDVSKSACENSSTETTPMKPFVTVAAANSYVNCINGENVSFRKAQPKAGNNVDQKMLELLQNANSSKSHVNGVTKTSDNACAGHACGHKCKQGDSRQTDTKKQDGNDHHRESRKCDCAYCEVFGTTISTHAHKTSETRDRLRSRLNQRREKVNESISKISSKPPIQTNSKLNAKSSSNINCAIKISGNPKLSPLIEKTSTSSGISKVNIRPQNEMSQSIPARIPEINQSVLMPTNVKSASSSSESKKPTTNEQSSLNHKNTVNKAVAVCTIDRSTNDTQPPRPSSSLSTNSLASDSVDSRDINELLNYIEGNKTIDKAVLAQKKAQKKARQRMKKTQEKERIEKERQLKEEEKKMREEARKEEQRKAEKLLMKVSEKAKKKKQLHGQPQQKQDIQKVSKKKNKSAECAQTVTQDESHLIEETIPAMVTIKRVCDGNNSPATVTITLKGSTPESDKLLFTLVNGQSNKEQIATAIVNSDKFHADAESASKANSKVIKEKLIENSSISKKKKKKKKKELDEECSTPAPATKEVKVTIAVDKSNVDKKPATNRSSVMLNENLKISDFATYKSGEDDKRSRSTLFNNVKDEINLPMLRLPPGITITKIEGPPINKNCKPSSSSASTFVQTNHSTNIPVSKSGVIVVDTEKLIQQSTTSSTGKRNKKKSRRKRDQQNLQYSNDMKEVQNDATRSSMVTLKNPIFHTLQTALTNKVAENSDLSMFANNQQASIFKNENGMVTIRSPRLHSSYDNGSPLSNFLSDLKPMFGAEVPAPFVPMCYSSFSEDSKNTVLNAQEILSGLPGIEITKVDKTLSKSDHENKKASQPAEVSIIPTNSSNNAGEKFNFDRDDWPFESVFTPKDVLEEDMDAEERELEAFKRFCQQSIPPERKEKVAHLNVKDIILNKKRDVTYS